MTQAIKPAQISPAQLLVREVNVLGSLPEICLRLRRILADPRHSRKDVAKVLQYDPSMSARVLRIVNCAYFGLPSRVNSISQALGILGEHELKNLVFVSAIIRKLSASAGGLDIHQFWKCSVLAAVTARHLAKSLTDSAQEEFFLAGLMLNIGKLVLYSKDPALHAEVSLQQAGGRPDFIIEQELLGFDHGEIGALMAQHWNFPALISECIAKHHIEPTDASIPQHVVMHFAGWFSDQLAASEQCDPACLEPYPFQARLLACLNLSFEACYQLLEQSRTEYLQVHEATCGAPADVH